MQHKILKKVTVISLALLSLTGCLTSNYYVLSTASTPQKTYAYKKMSIGVEKVSVPQYLFKREIAVASSSSAIQFLGDTWAEDLDRGLSQRLVRFIQKKFNQPNVHLYPWGVDSQPTLKVKVAISRFIAQEGYVYLDANWEVKNMHNNVLKSQLFSTRLPTHHDAKEIVETMDKAFGRLEAAVSLGIKNIKI